MAANFWKTGEFPGLFLFYMVYIIHKFRKIERTCMDLYLCTTSVAVLLLYIFMQRRTYLIVSFRGGALNAAWACTQHLSLFPSQSNTKYIRSRHQHVAATCIMVALVLLPPRLHSAHLCRRHCNVLTVLTSRCTCNRLLRACACPWHRGSSKVTLSRVCP